MRDHTRSGRLPWHAAAAALALSSCSSQVETVTPEIQGTMLSNLQAGKQTLTCTLNCMLTWSTQASSVHGLDLAEKWPDLAVRVMQIGFGNDLAYYYLGQAAQGQGYHQAAIAYYRYSLALATGSNSLMKCESGQNSLSDPCQGVNLVGAIPQLIQASETVLAQQQEADAAADAPAPVAHHHHAHKSSSSDFATPPPPAATSPATSTDSNFATPPPAAATSQ